jgi:hypothetical protein
MTSCDYVLFFFFETKENILQDALDDCKISILRTYQKEHHADLLILTFTDTKFDRRQSILERKEKKKKKGNSYDFSKKF